MPLCNAMVWTLPSLKLLCGRRSLVFLSTVQGLWAFCMASRQGCLQMLCALQDLQQATTLHFEFYSDVQQAGQGAGGPPDAAAGRGTQGGLTVINLPGLHRYSESEHAILERLVKRFKVPQRLRCGLVSAP